MIQGVPLGPANFRAMCLKLWFSLLYEQRKMVLVKFRNLCLRLRDVIVEYFPPYNRFGGLNILYVNEENN